MDSTPVYKIHPAIGIARVGNSPDSFYIAPERTGAAPIDCGPDGLPIVKGGVEQPVTQYKDAKNRIRRQAARFRVYVYDDANPDGRELKIGDTVSVQQRTGQRQSGQVFTGKLTDIQWKVYLANKKASWYEFLQLNGEHGYGPHHPLRNAGITDAGQRQKLIIDAGPRTVSWQVKSQRTASFARGTSPGTPETFPPQGLKPFDIDSLGQLMCTSDSDGHNRLLVLGGFGSSGSCKDGFGEPSIQHYANNDGWFDDTSDGPVYASLVIQVEAIDGVPVGVTKMQKTIPVDSHAWVITGYPRFVPQIVDIVTMDELVYDVAVRYGNYAPEIYSKGKFNGDYIVYFWRDIWPILERPYYFQFLMDFDPTLGGDPHQSGQGSGGNFDPEQLSIPPYEGEDPVDRKNRSARRWFLYNVLRKAGQENWLHADGGPLARIAFAMPLLCGDNPLTNEVPSKFFRLTDTMLFLLRQWAEGKFLNERLEDIVPRPLPEGVALDRGVLGNALGGAFCPGAEACWIMRNSAIYSEPYRIHIADSLTPGSLSQPNVVTGADTQACLSDGLEPGDLTKYSAVPWQADFNECSTQPIDVTYQDWNVIDAQSTGDTFKDKTWLTYWWPAHRPVMLPGVQNASGAWSPTPNTNEGDLTMVSIWSQLGFVIPASDNTPDTPDFQLVENQVGGGK
ncbi:MAG TPA: LodA/GoxA family CTQ-dependent oxidase [Terracidiphilus sp.]|nr:LodA/GoxA family CTQ-dependent oxidase [Terracidiphilus sp.]